MPLLSFSIMNAMTSSLQLVPRYCARLNLDADELLRTGPTLENLTLLQEAHIKYIPFENLAQHGAMVGGMASLETEKVAHKLLECNRGGFCFELNGLFSSLLEELGYNVVRVPSSVYIPELGDFLDEENHLTLMVWIPSLTDDVDDDSSDGGSLYLADVGFAEPAIHPLKYPAFDKVQVTPEGMISKIRKMEGDAVELWWYKDDEWRPRLTWKHSDATDKSSKPLTYFEEPLQSILHPESVFSQKSILTILNRDEKVTLAGNLLKLTSPRFPKDGVEPSITKKVLETEEEMRDVLQARFNIPHESSAGLSLTKSRHADPDLWTKM
jgi:N-hydroxyarylamine O-acetyltransferase